jgi:hypothetical protein
MLDIEESNQPAPRGRTRLQRERSSGFHNRIDSEEARYFEARC